MESRAAFGQLLRQLLNVQKLAVLSTRMAGGQPYASLVAFAAADDLHTVYFATARATRKFSNLQNDDRLALLISDSANQERDFHAAMAVTVLGSGQEIDGPAKTAALDRYLEKHPYLQDFTRSPTCAMIRVTVRTYILVRHFQQVMELHLER